MALIEGYLSKWTNVVKGWQFRWFVLDDNAGLLSYYTTKEKMMRGFRRGCVRLKGAAIGIDDDDDSTFTITVDDKLFHFQAQNSEERDRWIRALEDTILRHAQFHQKRWDPHQPVPTLQDFDRKLTETDAYLQILIEQVKNFESRLEKCEDENEKSQYIVIRDKANEMLESIKHSIVLLQIAKNTAHPINGIYNSVQTTTNKRKREKKEFLHPSDKCLGLPSEGSSAHSNALSDAPLVANIEPGIEPAIECLEEGVGTYSSEKCQPYVVSRSTLPVMDINDQGSIKPSGPFGDSVSLFQSSPSTVGSTVLSHPVLIPDTSYSSSEEEDYFDAKDDDSMTTSNQTFHDTVTGTFHSDGRLERKIPVKPIAMDGVIDYDAIYNDEDEEELGSVASHGSVISHLLSQVKLGMDLTKVVLPTFILERRSLLEMYADFFAHPDLFVNIADFSDPRDRMIQVVRWYLSAFHAGRKSSVAKKPYNPIIGEIFRCCWKLPEGKQPDKEEVTVGDGPVPWASKDQLAFIAEQVSHHPPISAFYAEHFNKRISFCAHIWTKSKFLGLSIGVHMIGQGCISVLDYDEDYIVTFPNGYGRSILTIPWVELGGATTISCAKTGYSANVEFLTKPFYGGKKHRVTAEIISPADKKPFVTINGEWNGCMHAKWASTGATEVFVDTTNIPVIPKIVQPVAAQEEMESRRLWKEVTAGLRLRDIEKATEAKFQLEQRQRLEAKERKDKGSKWETKHFHENGENWIYDHLLVKRLNLSSTSNASAALF